jgi:hypothetical protein
MYCPKAVLPEKDFDLTVTIPGSGRKKGASRSWRSVLLMAALVIMAGLLLAPCGPALPDAGGAGAVRQDASRGGRAVLVIIDRIGLDDIIDARPPTIDYLISRGGTSLMNARVKYDQYGLGSYLVIGAGGRALGADHAGLAFNSTERLQTASGGYMVAGSIYKARTGRKAPPDSIVNLYIEEMIKNSDTVYATSSPGLLGQVLKESGKKVTLLGNADSQVPAVLTEFQPGGDSLALPGAQPLSGGVEYPIIRATHREASCVAMDKEGLVPGGDVSSLLSDRLSPATGVRTDFNRLVAKAGAALATADLLVIDMGQTSRVNEQVGYYSDRRAKLAREKALLECDRALGKLTAQLDLSRDLLIICTPTPTRKMIYDGELLTPLILTGAGFKPGGLLRSTTTRRTGLVSNFDIAPTVIDFFGLKVPAEMEGQAVTSSNTRTVLADLADFRTDGVGSFESRKAMVRLYVITAIVILVLFFLVILIREELVWDHGTLWTLFLLIVLAGPLAYLLLPAFGVHSLFGLIPIAVGITLLLSLVALLWGRLRRAESDGASGVLQSIMFLSGLTLLLILLDCLLGSPLMTFSPFGSNAVLGDRYYGIGNLYMGVGVGSAVLFVCLAAQLYRGFLDKPWKRYTFAAVVLLVTVLFLGYPKLGANMGGLITAVAASSVTLMKLEGGRIGPRKIALLVVVLVIFVAAILAVEVFLPGSASHTGKAVSKAKSTGISPLVSQVGRKLAANWKLAFTSIWRILLLLSVLGGFLLNWKFRIYRRMKEELPCLAAGSVGMSVGLVVALLFNDSGIEPASALAVFLFFTWFLLLLGWHVAAAETRAPGEIPARA